MNQAVEPALLQEHSHTQSWQASLALRVEARGSRSVLAQNLHKGPLRVQKALYPEGDAVCQILMLHPPAGIAGGDVLDITLDVGPGAHAQLTTPGAGKWYKARGICPQEARQTVRLHAAANACLEWLPQEAIVFDGAQALADTCITLAADARCLGWDMLCLGRQASGEAFTQGRFRQQLRLQREDGSPLWCERMALAGQDTRLSAPAGLDGARVCGSFWIAGAGEPQPLLDALRALNTEGVRAGVSALPSVIVVRALAEHAEALRHHFEAAWALARPACVHKPALSPRIWRT